MKNLIAGTLIACSVQGSVVTEAFLSKVKMVESAGNNYAVGDQGRALGPYQMHAKAWKDVSDWRRKNKLVTYSYKKYAFSDTISREYCRTYCQKLEVRLKKEFTVVDAPLVYAAYNVGFSLVKQMRGDLNRLNPKTRQKSRMFK